MQGLNRVLLVGHLGQDPELRHTQSGHAVVSMRLATNENWTDREGERRERTEWHTVIRWGPRAEALARDAKKGAHLLIEGRLQTRNWEDRQGGKRYVTEVVANTVLLLGAGTGGERPSGRSRRREAPDETYSQPAGGGEFGDGPDQTPL